ncbi:hypothetical protein FZZ93_01045 [Halomonas eurihalina]|uniref:Sialate O-acetylesterase domain-containing protein n=1 Tax=Halomonas eurihalina TaxID=42566 RepID=A0A5D9DDU5_HALER|nr:sialate O-acetylesterase [Halomonas eurihalina]MDR5858223.1 sialate O-acetylesterase [Halomonas eurihalina]TZG41280.1 hypothetical protein FZZ93_01045 [Halomonas eurihalina]
MANNTGNPIGSADPRDLQDNARGLDRALLDKGGKTWVDRLGNTRKTLSWMEALGESLVAGAVYPDTATALGLTVDGQFFSVPSTGDDDFLTLYRNDAGEATLVKSYPSAAAVILSMVVAANAKMDLGSGVTEYAGAGQHIPIVTDEDYRILLGYDTASKLIFGKGLPTKPGVRASIDYSLGDYGSAEYVGSGPVLPMFTDAAGRILLGYDQDNGQLVGAGLNRLVSVVRAVNHMLFYGQSLSIGAKGTPVISTSQPYGNLTFAGGPRAADGDFSSLKPLVEDELQAPDGGTNRGETPCSGAANYASTTMAINHGVRPADHTILSSSAGQGGTSILGLKRGTAWYSDHLLAHISNAYALENDYALRVLAWVQGEADATSDGLSFSEYLTELETLQADIDADARGITGQTSTVPLLTYQCSSRVQENDGVALAQLASAQRNSLIALATPTYHLPHNADGLHLTAAGYKWMGAYFGRAYTDWMIGGEKPRWLSPVSATYRGTQIRVRFDVPTRPLVLDDTTLAATTDNGFQITDGGVAATINSISIDGDDVVLDLASTPTGDVIVRYALDHLGTGLGIESGGSGNLRDSTPDTITIESIERPLYHVSPAFELQAIELGE